MAPLPSIPGHARTPRDGRGFTMIEVIVVVVILAVLAGAMAPRLLSMTGREVRASAQAAGDLFSVAARRDVLTSQRVAVDYDADHSRIRLMTLAPSATSTAPEWHEDVLMPAVNLGNTQVLAASIDGVPMDPKLWRVEFPQGSRRPVVELTFANSKGKDCWTVTLPSTSDTATVQAGEVRVQADSSIDLDASGAGSVAW